ncbi:type II toxin-antitoxin system RelE family toxin [Sandaracinobacteroides saxicola]|uniref:Type II toxin-antitoxin system RelE/ParE family toxin n=1 Tax=Sandaracinobacteroides saxicola TaxID=2759707 RepID=A0A7G5IDU2_9SPHN|nr:type II toxin-antitoxin system RelE/ParE family toxin [Sandaracinobacteroides saxicola]QMW21534.1 type II toxin-antitoxin system RelE/ParE family toxin [Sandaracinobacteroides saxicola]
MVLRIEIEREAARILSRIPANVGDLIEDKIEQLASDPASLRNNVTRLVGTRESRLRVGDWRIIFRIDGDTLRIIRIAARGSVYG